MIVRFLSLDVHRDFAQVAILESGQLRSGGRILTTPEALRCFARMLRPDDEVVLEATCNTYAIVRLLQDHAGRVIVSNPLRTRAIAEARIKTDKVDAEVLVRLLAGGWLPDVWIPDDTTLTLRHQVAHRTGLVQQRTRLKNRIHSILQRNLVPGCPRSDLFGKAGRRWLTQHALPLLPLYEQATIAATLRELDVIRDEIVAIERTLAASALQRPEIRRLIRFLAWMRSVRWPCWRPLATFAASALPGSSWPISVLIRGYDSLEHNGPCTAQLLSRGAGMLEARWWKPHGRLCTRQVL